MMFGLQWFFDLLEKKKREEKVPDLKKAIELIVDSGCSVERNQQHLYYSKAERGYMILDFSKTPSGETVFPVDEKEEAINTFIEKGKVV